MSSIMIQDLAHSTAMNSAAMSGVRGGLGAGPNISVNVSLDQRIGTFQKIGINVLNNNRVIGAGFAGPDMSGAAAQWQASHGIEAAL
jgi:hypothetical protein